MVHDTAVKLMGVIDAAINEAVTGLFRGFGFPALDIVAGHGGVAGRDRVGAATVKVHADHLHIFRRGSVRHGGVGSSQVVREGFRRHDHRIGEPRGLQIRPQVHPDQSIELLGGPEAGLVGGIVVGFVRRGNRGQADAGVLAGGRKTGQVGGKLRQVRGVHGIGFAACVEAVVARSVAIDAVVAGLIRGRRTPARAENHHIGIDAKRLLRRINGR